MRTWLTLLHTVQLLAIRNYLRMMPLEAYLDRGLDTLNQEISDILIARV
jgi:hypothetical protein